MGIWRVRRTGIWNTVSPASAQLRSHYFAQRSASIQILSDAPLLAGRQELVHVWIIQQSCAARSRYFQIQSILGEDAECVEGTVEPEFVRLGYGKPKALNWVAWPSKTVPSGSMGS